MRAEDLRLHPGQEGVLPFRIDYVEELGSQRLVHGVTGDQAIVAAVAVEAPLPETASLSISPEKMHFFDSASGRRFDWAGQEWGQVAAMEAAAP